jgi:hypothetical protein
MISSHFSIRRIGRAAVIPVAAALLVISLGAAGARPSSGRPAALTGFRFQMVRTHGVNCLPNAHGTVTIVKGSLNDTMTVTVHGLPRNTGFDLFVIQVPNKPFGVAWYQSDLRTGSHGSGTVTVKGIFNKETFSVSVGAVGVTPAFPPTHQYHLGLWFNSPAKPFALGCEGSATSPIVTPFNGAQHAGIQILNTSNFPDNKGPLAHVS